MVKHHLKKFKKQIIGGSILVLGLLMMVLYHLAAYEGTDDAFVTSHVVPISGQVAGQVINVHVKDNQKVKAGDVLVDIDPREYQDRRDMALSDFQAAQSELKQALIDQKRYQELLTHQEISRQEFDRIVLRVQNDQAQVKRAKAKLDSAQLDLEHTKVKAPINGFISAKSVEKGQYLQVGQPLLSLVSQDVWVIANFKETQMAHIKPGNEVKIHADAYPRETIEGHVESIQAGTGAVFSLLPSQNATGNFIKVVQRVPVKILLDSDHPLLWPGLSVTAEVHVGHH